MAPSREENRWSVGASLQVSNVQALAASADELMADTIERYIRPELVRDVVLAENSGQVPVIDLSKLLDPKSMEGETAKLRSACVDWGFFQLVNHGIAEEILADVKRDMEKFFQLPLDKKNAYAQRPGEINGYGQAFVFSDDQKLDWGDMFYFVSQPPQSRDMSIWPNEPATIRSSIEEYSSELMKVVLNVATFIARTLNVDPSFMVDKCIGQAMRLNYYPPYMPTPEKVIGLSPHFDGCFLTLLLEVNSVEGLQIKRRGSWVPVKTQAKALLVNAGDFLEIVTNGKYKSIEHRVTINAHRERLTISAFHLPKFDALVSPVLGPAEEKVLYKTVRVQEYRKVYLSKDLNGKRALDVFKLSES